MAIRRNYVSSCDILGKQVLQGIVRAVYELLTFGSLKIYKISYKSQKNKEEKVSNYGIFSIFVCFLFVFLSHLPHLPEILTA